MFDGLPDTPLVTTDWLAAHLGDEGLVLLDATVLAVPGFGTATAYVSGDEEYLAKGHIPGAVFADLLESFSDPEGEYPFTHPDAKHFERAAQSVGVDAETAVVVYDNALGQWAARLWWLFRAFGYDDVRVLDGGLKKWVAEGRELALGYVPPRKAGEFYADERDELWADKTYVEAVVRGESDAVLVCGLPPREFSGEQSPRLRPGHIPGSVNAPAGWLVDRDTNAFLPAERLREVLGLAAETDSPVVTYCGSAIAATADALALTLIGHDDVRVYDGSLNEWASDANAPLEGSSLAAARRP